MKNIITFSSLILSFAATTTLLTACNKPSERPSEVNSKIAGKVFEVSGVSEITAGAGKASAYFSGSDKKVLNAAYSADINQVKMGGTAEAIIKKVTCEATKKAVEEQLKTGVIALVVLNDQVKILKVIDETNSIVEAKVTSLQYLTAIKNLSKSNEATSQAILNELQDIQYKSPAQLGEKFGLVEITTVKIADHGVLDNEKTDYQEKKSITNISKKPFEMSTHIVLGDEASSDPACKKDEAASEKASESAKK